MGSKQVDLIATVTPREGKSDRIIQLLSEVAEYVKNNEPQTLVYQVRREMNKKKGVEDIIMIESYADMGAFKSHAASQTFKRFGKAMKEEDLAAGPIRLQFVKTVGGFMSRL